MPPLTAARRESIQPAIACSQGMRSASVSGVPPCILATLAGGWKSSPSAKGQPRRSASRVATVVLPDPETPIATSTSGTIDPADQRADRSLERGRIGDGAEAAIECEVAAVGDEQRAVGGKPRLHGGA